MLTQAVVEFFKHKVVSSIIVLACWPPVDQIKFTRQLSQYGMTATVSCDPAILDHIRHQYLQGVLYTTHAHDDMSIFKKVKKTHFMMKYKWLIVGDHVPDVLRKIRYDSDIAFLKWEHIASNETRDSTAMSTDPRTSIHIYDAYVHPRDGIALNLWAHWSKSSGLVLMHERERILRRVDLKRFPLRIATPLVGPWMGDRLYVKRPRGYMFCSLWIRISTGNRTCNHGYDSIQISISLFLYCAIFKQELQRIVSSNPADFPVGLIMFVLQVGHYSSDQYDGTFVKFLEDESMSDQDPGIRSGYGTAMLLTEVLNAQDVLIETELWAAEINNNSMYVMVSTGEADISGAILRILYDRTFTLDYVIPIWPFRVGFTYLAERESSSNMFLEPFSPAVWWTCLAMMAILAMVEWITSKSPKEKDGALYTVLTTWLQQDASAVPEGGSGRFAFTVLSVSAMLVHAYYTSAIVSALMSTGRGGPDSLKALGDSKYAIGSEDYDYMRYLFFDVKTTWDDLEYLKKKKMTSYFYQELERGVELIQQGSTAFHSEYNQIYPHLKTFSDEHICKLQHVDTIPETLTWIQSTKDGQWTEVLRTAGGWLLETGLGKRLVARLRVPQPPCRASLLAERVKMGDIAPLLALTVFGALLSVLLLGVEIMVGKAKGGKLMEGDAKPGLEDNGDASEVVEYDDNNIIEP